MSEAEKLERHRKLHKIVTTHTSHSWATVLVKMLLTQIDGQNTARQTPYIPRDVLEEKYQHAKKRLFLLDYDVCHLDLSGYCVCEVDDAGPRSGHPRSHCEDAEYGRSNREHASSVVEALR